MSHVYLLGAGFTRAIIGDAAPLNDDVMGALSRKIDFSDPPIIGQIYEEAKPNIEYFLTLLDLQIIKHQRNVNDLTNNCSTINSAKEILNKLLNLRLHIKKTIAKLVGPDNLKMSSSSPNDTLDGFISSIHPSSTILTLNYDLVLDQGLHLSRRWSPNGGYFIHSLAFRNDNIGLANITFLKLHGSCNFSINNEGDPYAEIEINDKLFEEIHCDFQRAGADIPFVVLMSYIKNMPQGLKQLWRQAIIKLTEATRLTVIGCSLREEDFLLNYALYHFGMSQDTAEFNIDLVDIGQQNCNNLHDKIHALVAEREKQRYHPFPGGLKEYVEAASQR
ncbi:MAG: hypothetical protein KQJ78_01255 [Deltaproteobacteria bacterium]|nr:hypothetical protein [Deltaproteobacteria bacterium]